MDNSAFKSSSEYELQLIDCNCNNCAFLNRDLDKYRKWEEWHRNYQIGKFEIEKAKAISDAQSVINEGLTEADKRSGQGMMRVALKMKFQFDKRWLLNYGRCLKHDKEISFLPNVCQIHTQDCFKHRRSNEN